MAKMTDPQFIRDVIERAIKTAAQSGAALLTVDGTNILNLDWKHFAAIVGTAALYSVLTSFGSRKTGNPGTAAAFDKKPNTYERNAR